VRRRIAAIIGLYEESSSRARLWYFGQCRLRHDRYLSVMLENINLKKRLSREEYKLALPGLQQRLYDLEKACWEYGVPSVIVFEGWDAAGKGTAIAALTQRLDPRGFTVAH
jgi:polyphosphate kinase 2 (PPK2 family)